MLRKGLTVGWLLVCLWGILAPAMAWALDPNPPTLKSSRGSWPIRRQWTPAEVEHFGKWVAHCFKMKTEGSVDQRMAKIEFLLSDPGMNLLLDPSFAGEGCNPQLPTSIMRMMHASLDCAKFTQSMPAYYAYRRALPWVMSYVSSSKGDVRMAPYTIPGGTLNSFDSPSVNAFFRDLTIGMSSGNYRVPPFSRNSELSDSVPIAIDPKFLQPGCVNYTDGHCLLLAEIDKYGELKFLNAGTADTRDIYTYNGLNTVVGIQPRKAGPPQAAYEGCYQGLRVFRFPIAETDGRGNVTKVRRRTDAEMREFGYSLEQYDRMGDMVSSQKIVERGIELTSFHELIRLRMRTVDKVIPMQFMRDYVNELVEMWKFRESYVQNAWKDVLANGPISYPERRANENIFQAFGRWETWSSPSSDVDRRNKYFYLADWMDDAIDWFDRLPQYVDLTGLEQYQVKTREDLAKALIAEKNKLFNEKFIEYTNSKGLPVKLTLAEIEKRLYDLSFDPNHPPELRWGAKPGTDEWASVSRTFPTPVPVGSPIPMLESYKRQEYYRTVCQREQEESYLRDMYTSDKYQWITREKFDAELAKWYTWKQEKPPVTVVTQLPEAAGNPAPAAAAAQEPQGDRRAKRQRDAVRRMRGLGPVR